MLLIGSRTVTSSQPFTGRAATRGWCPGVLDPMETGDGWLLRMRLPGGAIAEQQIRVVAAVADEFGSGLIDITSRGNLQIRGVAADHIERAGDALVEAGLALPDAAADARRAIVASPLAGHDATAVRDSSPVVAELLSETYADAVPSKFGVVVDDGGQWNLSGIDADIRVLAVADGWAVGLRGTADLVGWTMNPVDVLVSGTTLCGARGQRMDVIAAEFGTAALLAMIGSERRPPAEMYTARVGRLLGVIVHPDADRCNVLAAPFLGRVDVAKMAALADLADVHGADLRFTTDHSVAICGVVRADAADVLARLAELNFAVSATDPRAVLSACVGSRGCSAAHADTWAVAEQMAHATPSPLRMHLSACAKRCGAPAGVTQLVADTNGSFR